MSSFLNWNLSCDGLQCVENREFKMNIFLFGFQLIVTWNISPVIHMELFVIGYERGDVRFRPTLLNYVNVTGVSVSIKSSTYVVSLRPFPRLYRPCWLS